MLFRIYLISSLMNKTFIYIKLVCISIKREFFGEKRIFVDDLIVMNIIIHRQ